MQAGSVYRSCSEWTRSTGKNVGRDLETYSVTDLCLKIKQSLTHNIGLVTVIGEVSNLTIAQSGHAYFTLKDQNSQIPLIVEDIDSLAHIVISLDDGARNYLKYFSRDIYKTHGHVKEIFINNPLYLQNES